MSEQNQALPRSFTGADLDRNRLAAAADTVLRHLRFEEALAQFCGGVIANFEGDTTGNRLMGQAGRFAMLAFVIALHARHRDGQDLEGATVTRLVELLGRRRLGSRGRTIAMVGLLRDSGLIETAPGRDDGRVRPLAPSLLMMERAAAWVETSLAPVALVATLPAPAFQLARDRHFVEQFFMNMAAPYIAEGFILYDAFPEIERLMSHTGGYALMIELLRTAQPAASGRLHAAIPPLEVAQRMRISRSQVRSLLDLAEAEGWLIRESGPSVAIAPDFAHRLRQWVATELAWGGDLARRASRSE